ncbi:MAG: type III secretion system export apparatus subunit SctT [Myxococcota bacterium]|jgi:flagellar biosynthetic protein FliR|nr:type III secretion system export apparatus subunit SctT [Myxococcota bacterium]
MDVLLQRLGIQLNYTQEFLIVALILGRTMPMIILTPFMGGKILPPELKMGMGAMLTILVWPLARGAITVDMPLSPIPFFLLMLKEVFIGFAIGFINSHIFWAMEMAGRIIDTVRGASMAEVMVPHTGQRATPFGQLYYQFMLVIFVGIGGHHIFIEAYFYSFTSLPIHEHLAFGSVGLEPFFDTMARMTAEILFIGVILSAPIVAATLISDIVFGILNRVAPQLNAYFMSMPVKAMGGVIMALLIMEPFVERLYYYSEWALRAVGETIELLGRS